MGYGCGWEGAGVLGVGRCGGGWVGVAVWGGVGPIKAELSGFKAGERVWHAATRRHARHQPTRKGSRHQARAASTKAASGPVAHRQVTGRQRQAPNRRW